jgi:hypothetical protein
VRCLIRFLTRGAAGALETRDRHFEGEALTLGRATDQVLHLKDRRVALEHARIVRREGRIVIQSLAAAGVVVNGSISRESRLEAGDVVQLGANLLRVIEAPAGVDLAFTFELDPAARSGDAVAPVPVTSLTAAGLGMRGWSWLLFGSVLLLFLVLPAAGLKSPDWRGTLRASALPSDHAWSSGPLAGVHQVVNQDCEICHREPFRQVGDGACLECHAAALGQHAPGFAGAAAGADRAGCTDCHREHDGGDWLVSRDDRTCAACHADLGAVAGGTAAEQAAGGGAPGPATDFGAAHPEFRPATSDTGLKFSHAVHLAEGGVESPVGVVTLDCGACHRPEPGGARLLPVDRSRDCADCHRLDFDPANPERQVPHGDARRVLESLVEYYSRRYLESYPDPLAVSRPGLGQRRPGPAPTPAEREAALRRATAQAEVVARDLFERRACVVCHEVQADPAAPVADRYRIRPVAVTAAWMPAAKFSHAAHGTALTPCATCHAAERSDAATDVLMPTLATCRDCHTGSAAPTGQGNRLATGCMTCHDFHRPGASRWTDPRPAPAGAEARP